MSSIYDSLNALKDTLNTSNEKVSSFRKQNSDFKKKLLDKINSVILQIQELAKNPNIQNIQNIQSSMVDTKKQLSDTQNELKIANEKLLENQKTITDLQNQQQVLQDKLQSSGDDNGKVSSQLKDLQDQLKQSQDSQNGIIQTIAQVNGVLAQQVQNIDELVNDSNGYNEEYERQIDDITKNLQSVVNLLNSSGSSSSLNPNAPEFVPTTGGRRSRKRKMSNMSKNKRSKKGGYIWSKSATRKRKGMSSKSRSLRR